MEPIGSQLVLNNGLMLQFLNQFATVNTNCLITFAVAFSTQVHCFACYNGAQTYTGTGFNNITLSNCYLFSPGGSYACLFIGY